MKKLLVAGVSLIALQAAVAAPNMTPQWGWDSTQTLPTGQPLQYKIGTTWTAIPLLAQNNVWTALNTYNGGLVIPYSAIGTSSVPINVLTVNSANNSERQITVSSAPTYNFPEALGTEFQGDFSKTVMPLLYTVSGTALGQPTTGYKWSPAVTPYQSLTNNTSGWNQSTSGNDGRTGYATFRTMIQQQGQGDTMAYYAWCSVQNTRAGATHWLASPACGFGGGDLGSSVDHAYLQGIGDLNFSDSGHDIAAVADVRNFIRTNNTASLGEIWFGYRTQSVGTKAIDVGLSLYGATKVGLDTSLMTGVSAAVNMAADQKLILNSSSTPINGINWYGNNFGGSWLRHSSADSQVQIGYNDYTAASFSTLGTATDHFRLGAFSGVAGLIAEGSSTDIYSIYSTKGGGGHIFRSGNSSGPIVFEMDAVASAVNFIKVAPSVTGSAPTLSVYSATDTDVGLNINTQNSGGLVVTSNTFGLTSAGALRLGKVSSSTGSLAFANASSANLTTLQAGNASAAVTYTLPTAAPAGANYALIAGITGTMSWASPATIVTLTPGTTPTSGGAAGQLMYDTGSVLQESANLVFASNALTIGKASTATGALTLANSGSAFTASIQSGANTPASWTLTLPLAVPAANGAILTATTGGVSSWTSILPVANGGTNCSSASITCFNNITGYTAAGATGTTSTNLVFSTSPTITTPTISGNETYTGTAGRILADFDNATVNSRRAFQTSTTNATTGIYALPNGTSTAASWQATNNSDPTNASKILIATNASTDVQLVSGINGTGTYLPLSIYTSGGQSAQFGTTKGTLTLGVNATATGQLGLANGGASGATVTVQNNGATTAYNFNLPTTVGTAGYLLTSQAGGASAMTWTSPTTTVNGQSCTLGSSCTVTAVASSLTFPQTVSGTVTSGGIPYFSSTTAMSSSALLAQYQLVVGGGAGAAPATLGATGSAGQHLQSGGNAANPSWTTATFPATTTAGTILASGTANTVTATATPTLGASGTLGSITMGNATSGTVTLQPTTGALGTVTASLPANTGTIAETNINNAFSVAQTISSTSANALAVGANGTTNPAFNIDASTASSATGLNVKSAAAAGGVAVSTLSSGTNENLTIDAKGSGTITLNGTATGSISTPRQIVSTLATGTAPFSVASTTQVTNLNASQLQGYATGTSGGTIPLLNGTNSWSSTQTFTSGFAYFNGTSAFLPQIVAANQVNDAYGGAFVLTKSRGVTPTSVQAGDSLGNFIWQGYDATTPTPVLQNASAYVTNKVDTVGVGSLTTHLEWYGQSQFWGGIASTSKTTGTIVIQSTGGLGVGGAIYGGGIVSSSTGSNALTAGANGTTNPALNVDASTASSATGLNIKSAAAGSGVALSAISSGANENMTIDAKGSGTIALNTTATGAVSTGTDLLVGGGTNSIGLGRAVVVNAPAASSTGFLFSVNGAATGYLSAASSYIQLLSSSASQILYLGVNNAANWKIDGSGNFLANADATYNIGASGANRPTNIYSSASVRTGVYVGTGSAPTGSGTCAISVQTGGNTVGKFQAGNACAIGSTVILTFATTAPTGYSCDAHDQTTPTAIFDQTANTSTTATFTTRNAATGAADAVVFKCMAY